MIFINASVHLGGTAALYKNAEKAIVCVFRNGEKGGTLIHSQDFPSVASAKAWRENTAQAMLSYKKTGS